MNRTNRSIQCLREEVIDDLIGLSLKNCSFCPDNIETATPKFPPDISKKGRIKRGEATVFPNLFPFAKYHAMATITKNHYEDAGDFTKIQIEDTISASMDYFRRIETLGAKYFTLSWNHLPPSGASIIHPHLQLIGDEMPTHMTSISLKASKKYYETNGENYWQRLVNHEEELGERFIGRTGKFAWISSFAPLGNNEISMVFDGGSSLLDLTKKDISDISEGLLQVFEGYTALGKSSFNFTVYSGLRGLDYFCLNARIITRPNLQKYYTSDSGFMETLHQERIVETLPESLASDIKNFF